MCLLGDGEIDVLQLSDDRTVSGEEDPGACGQKSFTETPADGAALVHRRFFAELVDDDQWAAAGVAYDVVHLHHLHIQIEMIL